MKLFLLALISVFALTMVACGGGATTIEKGKLVTGIITSSDSNVDDWKSQPYIVEVLEGVEYFMRLTSTDGNMVSVWSTDANDYIVEVNSESTARTVAYTFSETGPQELFLRSPDSDVPSSFTFELWRPSSS